MHTWSEERGEPELGGTVLLSGECRPLRRRLRPSAWMALEDVALDAVVEDGRLVARTSARRVADLLKVDPCTAAAALRALRQEGLLALEREKGQSGRFGLSVYVLGPVAGLMVLGPGVAKPDVVAPSLGLAGMAPSHTGEPSVEQPHGVTPGTVVSHPASAPKPSRPIAAGALNRAAWPATGTPSASSALQVPAQGTLDLDGGVA